MKGYHYIVRRFEGNDKEEVAYATVYARNQGAAVMEAISKYLFVSPSDRITVERLYKEAQS